MKDKMEKEKKRSTLIRSDKGLVHVVPSGSQRGANAMWKTPCGWYYKRSDLFIVAKGYEEGEPCLRCLGYA